MQRARAGNVAAFAQVYDRHAPFVLAVLQRMLRSSADAQDLLHDVFLEAWQGVRQYDTTRASVRTWLLVRTRSRALDRIAHDGRQQRLATDAHALEGNAAPRPERELALHAALRDLDAPSRDALELTYVWGFTASEISERTQVPEGTVRSRLARGLSKLGRMLDDPDDHEVEGLRHVS
jgi:RNA polymerase sigma-70 factor (ECF subfamily)